MVNHIDESEIPESFQGEDGKVGSDSEQSVNQQAQDIFKNGTYQSFQNVTTFSKAQKFSKQGDEALIDRKIDYISQHGLSKKGAERTTNLISKKDDTHIHKIQGGREESLREKDISRVAKVHDKVSERVIYNEVISYIHKTKTIGLPLKMRKKIDQLHHKITFGKGQPLKKSERDFIHKLMIDVELFKVGTKNLDSKIDLLLTCQKISSNYKIDNQVEQLSEIKNQSDEFINALISTLSQELAIFPEEIRKMLGNNPDDFREQLFKNFATALVCETNDVKRAVKSGGINGLKQLKNERLQILSSVLFIDKNVLDQKLLEKSYFFTALVDNRLEVFSKLLSVDKGVLDQKLSEGSDTFKKFINPELSKLVKSLDYDVSKLQEEVDLDPKDLENLIVMAIEENFDNNLKALAEHLLISTQVLFEKKEAGSATYNAYIIKKWKKYGPKGEFDSIMEAARKQFQQRFDDWIDGCLSDYTVKKAYRHALRNLLTNSFPKSGVAFSLDPAKSQVTKSRHFLTGVNKEGNLQIIYWTGNISREKHPGFLGAGTYGVAQKVYDLASGTYAAIKIAEPKKPEYRKDAEADLLNEGIKLKEVHKNGVCPGLQEPPWFVFNLSANVQGSNRDVIGVLGRLYNQGDMFDVIMNNPIKPDDAGKLDMALQLLKGGKALHTTMVHGDIKPENTFVRYDDVTGKWFAYIADFGDVKYKTDFVFDGREASYKNMKNGLGTTASPYYFTKGDISLSTEAVTDESADIWVKLLQRRDVYAIATTVWAMYTGNFPYSKKDSKLTFDTSKGVDPVGKEKITALLGAKATAILEQALAENPMDRPPLDDIISALEFSS